MEYLDSFILVLCNDCEQNFNVIVVKDRNKLVLFIVNIVVGNIMWILQGVIVGMRFYLW